MDLKEIIKSQREFFNSGATLNIQHRLIILSMLKKSIVKREKDICEALSIDLNKSETESYMTEIGAVLAEITYMQKHLKKLTKAKKVKTPLWQFGSKSYILPKPYGVTLIMSPWNYPFQLTFIPLVGAIAAGNTAIVKPSEYSTATSEIIKEILDEIFTTDYIATILGDKEVSENLLKEKFDYIFFTGSVNVGKKIMARASEDLTPITLELGGKSPCIVDETANLKLAAKRIVFGKFLNAGQTCIAPDYVFAHSSIKKELLGYMKMYITQFYGAKPLESEELGKIITPERFLHLLELMDGENAVAGGVCSTENIQIAPTILNDVTADSKIMSEEIFGPILPVLSYENIDEVEKYINNNGKPLALYIFSNNTNTQTKFLHLCSFGGGCVNDTIMHIANNNLPFGGIGTSGMGAYHGKKTFDTFTHYTSVLMTSTKFDLPFRYPPFDDKKLKLIKYFLK